MEGTTKSGFHFKLDEGMFDDYELLEALMEVDKGNDVAIVDVINIIFDQEQKSALKDHLRSENGRVSASGMIQEVAEILQMSKDGKNS